MFCVHCGAQQEDGAKFCTSCGKPLDTEAPQAAPQIGRASCRERV